MSELHPLRRKDRNLDPEAKRYMAWLHNLPCLICKMLGERQSSRTEAAHLGGNLAAKASNWDCVPLCGAHHRTDPNCEERLKRKFWEFWGLDKDTVLQGLWERFKKGET